MLSSRKVLATPSLCEFFLEDFKVFGIKWCVSILAEIILILQHTLYVIFFESVEEARQVLLQQFNLCVCEESVFNFFVEVANNAVENH